MGSWHDSDKYLASAWRDFGRNLFFIVSSQDGRVLTGICSESRRILAGIWWECDRILAWGSV